MKTSFNSIKLSRGHLQQQLKDKLMKHKPYIDGMPLGYDQASTTFNTQSYAQLDHPCRKELSGLQEVFAERAGGPGKESEEQEGGPEDEKARRP